MHRLSPIPGGDDNRRCVKDLSGNTSEWLIAMMPSKHAFKMLFVSGSPTSQQLIFFALVQ